MAGVIVQISLPAHFLDVEGQREGFVLLGAFLGSFLFIRTSARLMRSPKVPWWPGSVKTSSGLHLHHLVWGIVLVMLAGFVRFVIPAESPWVEIVAVAFGIGVGLTLDEFALWVHLRDVYWAEEGRTSFDAVVVAALLGGLIVAGAAPFDLKHHTAGVLTLAVLMLVDVLLSILAIGKGRRMLGLAGVFVPLISLFGTLRLARPGSPWARRWYRPGSAKLARAERRWARFDRRWRRFAELAAGAPTPTLSENHASRAPFEGPPR